VKYTQLNDAQRKELLKGRLLQYEADYERVRLDKVTATAIAGDKTASDEAKETAKAQIEGIEKLQARLDAAHATELAELEALTPPEGEVSKKP